MRAEAAVLCFSAACSSRASCCSCRTSEAFCAVPAAAFSTARQADVSQAQGLRFYGFGQSSSGSGLWALGPGRHAPASGLEALGITMC